MKQVRYSQQEINAVESMVQFMQALYNTITEFHSFDEQDSHFRFDILESVVEKMQADLDEAETINLNAKHIPEINDWVMQTFGERATLTVIVRIFNNALNAFVPSYKCKRELTAMEIFISGYLGDISDKRLDRIKRHIDEIRSRGGEW
jgi:cysteinyl-tRNA synthetase